MTIDTSDHFGSGFPADPIAAVTHANPYPYYDFLVTEDPFYYDDRIAMWVASSAEAVVNVLTSDLCHVRPHGEPIPKALTGSDAGEIFRHLIRTNDRDGRCAIKRGVSSSLEAIDAAAVAHESDVQAQALLNGIESSNDARRRLSNLAFQSPVLVIASLLGFGREQQREVCRELVVFVRCLAPSCTAEESDAGKSAATQLIEQFNTLLDNAATTASGGLLARLSHDVEVANGDHRFVVIANGIGLLFQTYEATAGLIGNTLLRLAKNPDLCSLTRKSPELVTRVVSEVLRYDSPVQNTRRFVARTATIMGNHLRDGDAVLVVLAAANRDPMANANPEVFDIDREGCRIFTFGHGSHACPGQTLAVTIAAQCVARVIESGIDLQHLADDVCYRPSANVRIPNFERESLRS